MRHYVLGRRIRLIVAATISDNVIEAIVAVSATDRQLTGRFGAEHPARPGRHPPDAPPAHGRGDVPPGKPTLVVHNGGRRSLASGADPNRALGQA
jgi:hypothetical protein